ncbi:D-glycerate dehydrogenase [bacterium LRH843]|nr:D-glycerate dehydrogenase [bacterium LRH843]
MKPTVFINKPVPEDIIDYIREHCVVEVYDGFEPLTREELFKKLENVDGFLTSGGKIDDELLEHAPKLRVVSNISVGYNNFNIEAMKKHNITGTHTPYVLDDTVADLVLGLMLSSARRIAELDKYVKAGNWDTLVGESLFGVDVHHATVGIIGMGRIGEAIAKRCKFGFDMNVLYHSRNRKEEIEEKIEMEYTSLNSLLEQSDFVVLMTPLSSETRHLMSAEQFKLMKKSAIFINASRGATVDEGALIEALSTGEIRGAGLDVFTEEPTSPDNPLLSMDQVVALPHIGSATARTRYNMAKAAATDLVSALTGEKPKYIVKELV